NSALLSRAPWPMIPESSWPTNRPEISIQKIRSARLSFCKTLSIKIKWPCSWSLTIQRSRKPAIGYTRCKMVASLRAIPADLGSTNDVDRAARNSPAAKQNEAACWHSNEEAKGEQPGINVAATGDITH